MPLEADIVDSYKKAGKIAGDALDYGAGLIKEGSMLIDIAEKIEEFIKLKGGKPAFPVNIAIDSIAAHFSPFHDSKDVFIRGNLVKLDVGVHINGYIGDTARTIEIGTQKWGKLIKASEEALKVAIEMMRPKVSMETVGTAVENTINTYGYVPISNLSGHGLGQYSLHSGISVPNVSESSRDRVQDGMVLAIEPFATDGVGSVKETTVGSIYRLLRTEDSTITEKPGLLSKILGKSSVD
jgi:methionyl aminopeptidase